MNQTQLQRAENDARLYNTDGRFYDVDEVPGVLEIHRHASASSSLQLWVESGIVGLGAVIIMKAPWISHPAVSPFVFKILICGLFTLVMERVFKLSTRKWIMRNDPTCWMFDRLNNQWLVDKSRIASLDEIVAVEAQKKWRRFFVDIRLRDGRRVRLGLFGFASKEWAWRQDAAQIAGFLSVPLQIPEP